MWHDVLLLDKEGSLHEYQIRLRTLHNLGMINLSLVIVNENTPLSHLQSAKHSLQCKLREANKRAVRANAEDARANKEAAQERSKRKRVEQLLAQANQKFNDFIQANPDYQTQKNFENYS